MIVPFSCRGCISELLLQQSCVINDPRIPWTYDDNILGPLRLLLRPWSVARSAPHLLGPVRTWDCAVFRRKARGEAHKHVLSLYSRHIHRHPLVTVSDIAKFSNKETGQYVLQQPRPLAE